MPFELVSGLVGALIAKGLSRVAPPQKNSEFAAIPPGVLRRRNRNLYLLVIGGACLGFVAPIAALALGGHGAPWRNEWLTGIIFGLPFLLVLAILGIVRSCLGASRARELLFYVEQKEGIHIYAFYLLGAPLAVLGLISMLCIWL